MNKQESSSDGWSQGLARSTGPPAFRSSAFLLLAALASPETADRPAGLPQAHSPRGGILSEVPNWPKLDHNPGAVIWDLGVCGWGTGALDQPL